MSNEYQNLKIFVSSPGDVAQEREIIKTSITKASRSLRESLSLNVEYVMWEEEPVDNDSETLRSFQERLNRRIKDCHVFLLILWKRSGSHEIGKQETNTEREIRAGLKMVQNDRKKKFISFFRHIETNDDQGPQERQVRILRDALKERLLAIHYADLCDFQSIFPHVLYDTVLRYRFSTSKARILRSFWQLGTTERIVQPKLAIVIPPVERRFMRDEQPDEIWNRRLIPHLVFEDFKALQKTEKTLRLIGFRDYKAYSPSSIPANIHEMNRVWICLPRSATGSKYLKHYEQLARFRFEPGKGGQPGIIRWRSGQNNKKWITVQSPLAEYLKQQRQNGLSGGEWTRAHGKVYAKDFAVLARFPCRNNFVEMADGTLKDYFIAGIRGLGTWGAAWLLDRQYSCLQKFGDHEDAVIEMLLEVIYWDDRIQIVKDVSEESQSYFLKENKAGTIKHNIEEKLVL